MSAMYSFSSAARNCASRVAGPTSTISSPVASGSRVPVWPTRDAGSVRRTKATTSCEVGPDGLSMSRAPAIMRTADGDRSGRAERNRLGHLLQQAVAHRGERAAQLEAGGVLVATAAVPRGD